MLRQLTFSYKDQAVWVRHVPAAQGPWWTGVGGKGVVGRAEVSTGLTRSCPA